MEPSKDQEMYAPPLGPPRTAEEAEAVDVTPKQVLRWQPINRDRTTP
jgi:hypothetical protein